MVSVKQLERRSQASQVIYFIAGALVFLPLQPVQGFYLSYVSALLLIPKLAFRRASFYLLLLCFLGISISSFLNQANFTSLVNPMISILLMSSVLRRKFPYKEFVSGVLVGLLVLAGSYIWTLYQVKLSPVDWLILLSVDRSAASEYNPLHGNWIPIACCIVVLLLPKSWMRAVALLVSISSGSRLFIVVALFSLHDFFKKYNTIIKYGLMLLVITLGMYLVAFLLLSDVSLLQRYTRTDDRFLIVNFALQSISDNFFFGIGDADYGPYTHAHNSLLHMFVVYGAVGFFPYACTVLLFLTRFSALQAVVIFMMSLTQLVFHVPSFLILSLVYFYWSGEYFEKRFNFPALPGSR